MDRKKFIIILIFIKLSFFFAAAADFLYFKDKIYPGIFINNIDISCKKAEEVREELSRRSYENVEVVFKFDEVEEFFTLEELGIKIDTECLVSRAYRIGRNGNIWRKLQERYHVFREKEDLALCYQLDHEALREKMNTYADLIYEEPVNAEFLIKGDEININPGLEGLGLDIEKSIHSFLTKISCLEEEKPVQFPLITEKIEPEITTEQLEKTGVKNLLAKFSTVFTLDDNNRIHNMKLSSSLLDKHLMDSGDMFSFNQVVGEATSERGFKEAPVIISGEFVPGIGGGICQVSSTVYNAALLAGLEIIERSNHGRAVGYLPPGFDATIAYNYKDLRFKNNLSHHILLSTEIAENKLIIRIFGKTTDWERIEIKVTDLKKIEPQIKTITKEDLPAGKMQLIQSGSPGYKVAVSRIFYEGNEEVKREKLSSDIYRSSPTIYHVGKEEQGKAVPAVDSEEEEEP